MNRVIFLLLACVGTFVLAPTFLAQGKAEQKDDRPFFALWRMSHGRLGGSPALRFAIWNDGRVLFAKDPRNWNSELQCGRIASYRIDRLKQAIRATGVFSLHRTSSLVPSGDVIYLTVEVAGRDQVLNWDEVESPNYGININPQPHDHEFVRCWKQLDALGLVACPDQLEKYPDKWEPASSWYRDKGMRSK